MKYTLISKTGKVADLQLTPAEALAALRVHYGDNGRAIIRELLAFGYQTDQWNPVCAVMRDAWQGLDPILTAGVTHFCWYCGQDGPGLLPEETLDLPRHRSICPTCRDTIEVGR